MNTQRDGQLTVIPSKDEIFNCFSGKKNKPPCPIVFTVDSNTMCKVAVEITSIGKADPSGKSLVIKGLAIKITSKGKKTFPLPKVGEVLIRLTLGTDYGRIVFLN